MAPKFGALALSRIDWPAMATVWLTPGVFRAISSILLHDAVGAARPTPSRAIAR